MNLSLSCKGLFEKLIIFYFCINIYTVKCEVIAWEDMGFYGLFEMMNNSQDKAYD